MVSTNWPSISSNCTLPVEEGGFDGDVFYIDTEDTLGQKNHQSARGLDLDPDQVLSRIHVARAYNSAHKCSWLMKSRMSKGLNVKMIIVDSLTSHLEPNSLEEACWQTDNKN